MDRAVNGSLLKDFDVAFTGHIDVTVTHLLFTDDTLVLCDVEMSQLAYLR